MDCVVCFRVDLTVTRHMQGVPGDCSDGLCCVFQGIFDSDKVLAGCVCTLETVLVDALRYLFSGHTELLQETASLWLETVL